MMSPIEETKESNHQRNRMNQYGQIRANWKLSKEAAQGLEDPLSGLLKSNRS